MKLEYSNCGKTKKIQIVMKLKKTQFVTKFKTQIVMKLKNSYCEKKTQLKMWQCKTKTQIVTKLKKNQIVTTQKLKLWQKSNCDETQIVTKLKLWQNSNCEEIQVVTVVTKTSREHHISFQMCLSKSTDKVNKKREVERFSKHQPSGPMLSISQNVRLSVRPSVCPSMCSLLRYRLNVFLPPLHKVGCPIFLEAKIQDSSFSDLIQIFFFIQIFF